jgi:DNA-binding IclR family transcriptional regulator
VEAGEVAELLGLDLAAVQVLLSRLELAGLVAVDASGGYRLPAE